jgi:hypothetical protein
VVEATRNVLERMGSKRLTADNFLLPDPLSGEFTGRDGDGPAQRLSAVDWAHEIRAVRLDGNVPEPVRNRFDLARGILRYGFFWYSLWVHGTVVSLQSAELALEVACDAAHGPKRLNSAESRIEWLEKRRFLAAADAGTWTLLVGVRDALVEAGDGPILTPRKSLDVLQAVAQAINGLFRVDDAEEEEE